MRSIKMKGSYYCPRCGGTDIEVYADTFDCKSCKGVSGLPLGFDKDLFDEIEDKSSLLATEEIMAIGKILTKGKKRKIKRLLKA